MDEKMREDIALFRFGLIANLVNRELAPGEKAHLLREVVSREHQGPTGEKQKVSIRSLERNIQVYREGGFEALKPSKRASYLCRAIPEEVLEKAIELKKERPERTVLQILRILELAGIIQHGQVSESTLSKQLRKRGIIRQKLNQEQKGRFRRFEAPYRNACWQGDVQHTLYFPDPQYPDKRVMVKLFVFLDDYSRFCVQGEFYLDERSSELEDCLQKAMIRYGKPEKIYVDNGAIYRSRVLQLACAKLGIKLSHSKPGRPEGSGNIERFFQFVDSSFKPEAYDLIETRKIVTVEQLNQYYKMWLDMLYHERIHGETKQSPRQRFEESGHPLTYPTLEELKDAFLWEETRKVDKASCIHFQTNIYEVDESLIGKVVTLRYDPLNLVNIQVWYEGKYHGDAAAVNLQRNWDDRLLQPLDQPELRERLRLRSLEAISQRITTRFHLHGVNFEELKGYIQHHLKVVEEERLIFTESALKRIFTYTRGILRKTNNVCTSCLLDAVARKQQLVDEDSVERVLDDYDI